MSATRDVRELVDDSWIEAARGSTLDDRDPYTGQVVARVPAGGRDDARRAIDAASRAFADGSEPALVHLNDQSVHHEPPMLSGGVEDSGWGRFGGSATVHELTELRRVTVETGTRPFPF